MNVSSMNWWEMVLVTVGLVVISALSRSFFFLSSKAWQLPPLVERGLRYAPLAALSAVVAPDILLTQGQWLPSWTDPRWGATLAAVCWAAWRRDMLGTIVVGMGVLLGLRFGLGW
ncbi:MAG TPA: AzlD domain-containing protein [Aquabacterium sp.]|nr:AzlD domain-containing protein [Aquabacterium sp.]HRH28143.1 AzlD domain-containing protein [Aquabacterium sp.]